MPFTMHFSYKICKYMQCICKYRKRVKICKICSYKYRLTAFRGSKTDIYEVSYRYGNPVAICIFAYFQALIITFKKNKQRNYFSGSLGAGAKERQFTFPAHMKNWNVTHHTDS